MRFFYLIVILFFNVFESYASERYGLIWDLSFPAIPWYGMGLRFSSHTIHGMIRVFGGLSHGMVYVWDIPY